MYTKSMTGLLVLLAVATTARQALAQLPVTGRPVSQLAWLDTKMVDLMNEFSITGGMLAVMRNGHVIYQRGFGWNDSGENIAMPENSLCRIASCTKPITAAAIRKLESEGRLSVEDYAFDLGQSAGGILQLAPFPSLGDSRLRDVRIRHLLVHSGGWDRGAAGVGDLTYKECEIAGDMDVTTPPGRTNTMRWILGQPLQFSPGMRDDYSNIGFLALGLIVEKITGQTLITYLRQNILTNDMWIPSSDFRMGRTFEADAPAREAWYDGRIGFHCVFNDSNCVFGCSTSITNSAYGSWDHEARTGQGAVVLSPATALRLLNTYYVQVYSDDIGLPLDGVPSNGSHGGSLQGCNTAIWQRSDGINVFVFFNKDPASSDESSTGHYGNLLLSRIDAGLDSQTNWPTLDVEGFWAAPIVNPLPAIYGSYDRPFHGIPDSINTLGDGSKLILKAGDYAYNGTISTKLQIRSPLGLARIGG